jgi:hypothetical protein
MHTSAHLIVFSGILGLLIHMSSAVVINVARIECAESEADFTIVPCSAL